MAIGTILGATSIGVGLYDKLFGESKEEQLRKFYAKIRKQKQESLDKFSTAARNNLNDRVRAQTSSSKARNERLLSSQGLLDTSTGISQLNEADNDISREANQARSDLDLNILRKQSEIDNSEQPVLDEGFGGDDLLAGGLDLLTAQFGRPKLNKNVNIKDPKKIGANIDAFKNFGKYKGLRR